MGQILVRAMVRKEFDIAARMHAQMLSDEFIVRYGLHFLRRYYRAFSESPCAVALVAVENTTNTMVGALLGTLNSSLHYRYMTRRHGVYLAGIILIQSLFHFALAKDLIRTRAKRYALGVVRSLMIKRRLETNNISSNPVKVGDITHLFVNRAMQMGGIGSSLILTYKSMAQNAGVECLDLATAPIEMGGAGPFYEKLGWTLVGTHVSSSGEEFLLYRLHLPNQE